MKNRLPTTPGLRVRRSRRPPVSRRRRLVSGEYGGFLEGQARRTVEYAFRVAVSDIDQEVGSPAVGGEKCRVDRRVVEARHRADVQAEGASGYQQVGALQRAVAKRGRGGQRVVAGKPGGGIRIMRKEIRQLL